MSLQVTFLKLTWQNNEIAIKRLTDLGVFNCIHYVKLENSLVHDVSQESNNKLHKQVVQIPVPSTSVLAFVPLLSPIAL